MLPCRLPPCCVQPRVGLGAEGRPGSPRDPRSPAKQVGVCGRAERPTPRRPGWQAAGAQSTRQALVNLQAALATPSLLPTRLTFLSPNPRRRERNRPCTGENKGRTSNPCIVAKYVWKKKKSRNSPDCLCLESKPAGPQIANSNARSHPIPNCRCGRAAEAAGVRAGTWGRALPGNRGAQVSEAARGAGS